MTLPPPQLRVHRSNRLETLADLLCAHLDDAPASPLETETIVVPSRGLGRWLGFALAERRGIAAGLDFPYPQKAVQQIARAFFPELPESETDPYAPERLVWTLDALLADPATGLSTHPVLAPYLQGGGGLRRYRLASRLAHVFDQYRAYRPEMLRRWENGADRDDWQACLWRVVYTASGEAPHLGRLLAGKRTLPLADETALPRRLFLFATSTLPPLHLALLQALGEHRTVDLYLLAPNEQYWGDVVEHRRIRAPGELDLPEPATEAPLLARLGRQAREMIDLCLDCGFDHGEEAYAFAPQDTLLGQLQGLLRVPEEPAVPAPASPKDDSVQVHGCAHPLRAVQVLRDQLLEAFAHDPDLHPRDILVLAPDLERYAPAFEAVFAHPEDPARRIPFHLADRPPRRPSSPLDTLLRVFALAESRATLPELVDLLESSALAERFSRPGEAEALRAWLQEARLRWGLHGAHRARLGLPASDAFSWQSALERLLLSIALPAGEGLQWNGQAPVDGVEGSERLDLLGRLATTMEDLRTTVEALWEARPLAEWPAVLRGIAEKLFSESAQAELGGFFAVLAQWEEQSGGPVLEAGVLAAELEKRLGESGGTRGFLQGSMTVAALQPLRAVPAKVICLLGLDEDAFPHADRRPAFDRILAERQRGDRSPRDDDRNLLLETILAAREKLLLFYLDREPGSGEVRAPSPLVDDLAEALGTVAQAPGGGPLRDQLFRSHPATAYDRRYFDGSDPRFFTYSRQAEVLARGREDPPEARESPRPTVTTNSTAKTSIDVADLLEFVQRPARFTAQAAYGMKSVREEEELPESEPFTLSGLERYAARQAALGHVEGISAALAAGGYLPAGETAAGEALRARAQEAARLHELRETFTGGEPTGPLAVAFAHNGFRLQGELPGYCAGKKRFVLEHAGSLRGRHRLHAATVHLLGSLAGQAEAPTVLLSADPAVEPAQYETSGADVLDALLALFERARQGPVTYLPESAYAYWQRRHFRTARQTQTPWQMARAAFHGNPQTRIPAESDDADLALLCGPQPILPGEETFAADSAFAGELVRGESTARA